MGDDRGEADRRPAREVQLSDYCIDVTEVTNAAFVVFLEQRAAVGQPNQDDEGQPLYDFWDDDDIVPERILDNGDGTYAIEAGYENHPVTEVWHWSGRAYCDDQAKALPTEAQWENAARGPDAWEYPWGTCADCDVGNIRPGPEGVGPDAYGSTRVWTTPRQSAPTPTQWEPMAPSTWPETSQSGSTTGTASTGTRPRHRRPHWRRAAGPTTSLRRRSRACDPGGFRPGTSPRALRYVDRRPRAIRVPSRGGRWTPAMADGHEGGRRDFYGSEACPMEAVASAALAIPAARPPCRASRRASGWA